MNTDRATPTAAALLAIPDDCPERLFAGSADDIKRDYRRLAMQWHPDRCRDADAHAVFQHIRRLYEVAEQRIARGEWSCREPLTLTASDGRTYAIDYLRRHAFELGTMYVANTVVAFVVDDAHADLVRRAGRVLRDLRYADDGMRSQVAPYLPAFPFAGAFRTDDACVIVMRKQPGDLLLRDVLDHVGGRLDARHVAWVVSSLLNLCCYFQYAGIVHNALSPDTCFMSPQRHAVAVLGGWWYAAQAGERMVAAPAGTIAWAAHDLLHTGRADLRTDLELVRALGRELLGDISGARLARAGAAPTAMIDWLRLPASDDPIEEYRTWRTRVLPDSFGARRFVELPLTQSDIYR
jgi:serine/threonine protein kinase